MTVTFTTSTTTSFLSLLNDERAFANVGMYFFIDGGAIRRPSRVYLRPRRPHRWK